MHRGGFYHKGGLPPFAYRPEHMHILIAEDSPSDALFLTNILEHAGHRVRTVRTGREALARLVDHPEFSLLVADVRMPELDGVGLVRAVRQNPDLQRIPVVIVSGAADAATVKQAVGLGLAGYILKPVTEPSRVLACVYQALREAEPVLAAEERRVPGQAAPASCREACTALAAALRALSKASPAQGALPTDDLVALAASVGAARLHRALTTEGVAPAEVEREMKAALNVLEDGGL